MTEAQATEVVGCLWEILELLQSWGEMHVLISVCAVAGVACVVGVAWLIGMRIGGS